MYSYEGKYSKQFMSHQLTNKKFKQLTEFAVSLRNYKNQVSEEVNSDLMKYINMMKFEFISYMRSKYSKQISSYFEEALYGQVYSCYYNRFDAIIKKISFKKRIFVRFNLYKRNTKDHKKGDLKSVIYKNETTDLSLTLTYLARYGSENIIDYINTIYNDDKTTDDKRKFYDKLLKTVNKFGFDRLYKLALTKRNRIINCQKYKNPIEFTSLSFSGKTAVIPQILDYNKRRHSKFAAFITINVPFRKDNLCIPVKVNYEYHGNINDYKKDKEKAQYIYTITFTKYNQINVILCKDGERKLPENKTNYIGIDVNLKHNLFALSDGTFYDFDREFVEEYVKELNKLDELKKNREYKQGKRSLIKFKTLQRKIKSRNQRLISDICKDLKAKGYDHIILENLDNSFGKSYSKNEEYDEKYNRLSHMLQIGSLKDEFKHIAVKYDISVSFVQSEYTSQMCMECGCIDTENRTKQEVFECINCGSASNADTHAAINILNRVTIPEFRNQLLNINPDGSYSPKKLSHDKVCEKIQKSVMKLVNQKK